MPHKAVQLTPPPALRELEPELLALRHKLLKKGHMCATAESCTGGMIGAACTSLSGASQWYAGGIIAYANSVKTALLGVPASCIEVHGAVSREVVSHMAHGLCKALRVPVGLSISGIAGPDGGSLEKPVGTIWLGYMVHGQQSSRCLLLQGTRDEIRQQAMILALRGLTERL